MPTVRALAAALHLAGSPQRVPGGWRVTGTGTLQVMNGPGLRWTYAGASAVPRCGGAILQVPRASSAIAAAGSGASTGSHARPAGPTALDRM